MTKDDLKNRTKQFALGIIDLIEDLLNTNVGYTVQKQIIPSGTSVAANYHAACRAKSNADFVYKITIVEEECDETLFLLELIKESNLFEGEKLQALSKEADELTAIFTASGKTAKQNNPK